MGFREGLCTQYFQIRFLEWKVPLFVCMFLCVDIYEMEPFEPKVGRCFALISNQCVGFDLFVTMRSHFLLSEHSLSFNNEMITLTSARRSARIVELATALIYPHDFCLSFCFL